MRAAWHDAFAAITRTDGVDVRELPDQSLQHMRASYQAETGWAPPHVGKQLREVRLGAGTMRLKAIRAEEEARLAKDPAVAARHVGIAGTARGLEAKYRERETLLGEVIEERELWDKLTEGGRRLAIQADLELRRRHPGRKIRPLESAEPPGGVPVVLAPRIGASERWCRSGVNVQRPQRASRPGARSPGVQRLSERRSRPAP
jgi:hypothetical protein